MLSQKTVDFADFPIRRCDLFEIEGGQHFEIEGGQHFEGLVMRKPATDPELLRAQRQDVV